MLAETTMNNSDSGSGNEKIIIVVRVMELKSHYVIIIK